MFFEGLTTEFGAGAQVTGASAGLASCASAGTPVATAKQASAAIDVFTLTRTMPCLSILTNCRF
jgi:hypothetical protein